MFYCPNCNNIYDITKTIPNNFIQTAGQVSDTPETISSITNTESTNANSDIDQANNIIQKILKGDKLNNNDLNGITLDSITKNTSYKKLQAKSKELVYNKLLELFNENSKTNKSITPISSNAYFICKNCGNNEPIKSNTLIARKYYGESNDIEHEDFNKFKEMANVKCLPLSRNYICPNKKCLSHTDFDKREARFYRISGSFRIRYVCIACGHSWTS